MNKKEKVSIIKKEIFPTENKNKELLKNKRFCQSNFADQFTGKKRRKK